jgi:hypothetical protein
MIYFLMAASFQPDPEIMVREPTAASPWVQSVDAKCGNDLLQISGYGAASPLNKVAQLRVNGTPVAGDSVKQMQADLSERRAAYRLEITCGEAGVIFVRISQGLKEADGATRFRFSAAALSNGRLRSYTGFQEGTADDFWFR